MPFMRIHQLSASYEAIQDRIVLRINTHEGQQMALWFTRRFLGQLFPTLLRYEAQAALQSAAAQSPDKTQAHSPEAQQMLAELKREEVLQHSDFATPYQAPAPDAPQDFAPMLVTQVRFSQQAEQEAGIGLHFEEQLSAEAAPRGLQLQFNAQVFMGLVVLLQQTVRLAEWADIDTGEQNAAPPPDSASGLHVW